MFISDEEVDLFATIKGNTMTYNGIEYKIIRATNDGYYIKELIK